MATSAPPEPAPALPPPRRSRWGITQAIVLSALAALLVCCMLSVAISYTGATANGDCGQPNPRGTVMAGAATADISPTAPVYLGGYGIGPVRRSTGVMQPLLARAVALRSGGATLVLAAIDSQGYFAAYQAGPYGLDAIRATVAGRTGIPVGHIIIAATHSHAAPDTVGFWGGVPPSYLRVVRDGTITAILAAVAAERPARLSAGTASVAGLTATFGDDGAGGQGSGTPWPVDDTLRVMRVVGTDQRPIATLLNVSIHPTALGAHNTLAAPDWPGIAAQTLETQVGGTAVVLVGALGHTWPRIPPSVTDDVQRVTQFGAAIGAAALSAVAAAHPLADAQMCVADRHFRQADTTAPLLLGLQAVGSQGGTHILRATTAPYFIPPDVLSVEVTVARIGDLLLCAMPVEPYPALLAALQQQFPHRVIWPLGMANDQLGYAPRLSEYIGAVASSPTDEGLFVLDPGFGEDLLNATADGIRAVTH